MTALKSGCLKGLFLFRNEPDDWQALLVVSLTHFEARSSKPLSSYLSFLIDLSIYKLVKLIAAAINRCRRHCRCCCRRRCCRRRCCCCRRRRRLRSNQRERERWFFQTDGHRCQCDQMLKYKVAQLVSISYPKCCQCSFFKKTLCLQNSLKVTIRLSYFWDIIFAKNFKKSPNLVTLLQVYVSFFRR